MSRLMLNHSPWQRLGMVALGLSAIAVFTGTVLPAIAIGWLRVQAPLFASTWDWLDRLLPVLNPLHILLYAWIALLWRLLAPQWPRWSILLLGSICAVTTEALQMFAPGRTPRISDALNDIAGIILGLALATIIGWARRRPTPW